MQAIYFIITVLFSLNLFAAQKIVYTARNLLDSRIYFLNEQGKGSFTQYSPATFTDMAVHGDELYVAEATAPRVYQINLKTGDSTVVIDDWSLTSFTNVAFDGKFFYVKEYNFRKYDRKGNLVSTAPFDRFVYGSAWDGKNLWILGKEGKVTALDITAWPKIVEISSFRAPSPNCRGLSFDGKNFWTAESLEDGGKIFQIDPNGKVLQTLPQPTGKGWGAALINIP